MPDFEPFRALRYAAQDLEPLIAPPYDVLSEAEVDELHARSPHNISHLDDPRGDDRYVRAGRLLQDWQNEGVLATDPRPAFTIYRRTFTDATGAHRQISGVLGGLQIVDEGAGGVLPHERTTPKASTDRLELTRATRANLSPIWGLSLAAGLSRLLAAPGELVGLVVDGDGEAAVEHRVERVADPDRVQAIRSAVGAADVLIADGHHRYQISRTYRDEVRAHRGGIGLTGPAEQTLAFVSELVADQLSVAAIHRLYSGVATAELHAALERSFEISALGPSAGLDAATLAAMQTDGFLVLVGPDGAERLRPRSGVFADVRALDGVWLEQALDGLEAEVSYQHGLAETVAAVDSGAAVAAVLIRPVGVAEIERTAREGVLMPPKSTFFTPKLKTGFVVRSLAGAAADEPWDEPSDEPQL